MLCNVKYITSAFVLHLSAPLPYRAGYAAPGGRTARSPCPARSPDSLDLARNSPRTCQLMRVGSVLVSGAAAVSGAGVLLVLSRLWLWLWLWLWVRAWGGGRGARCGVWIQFQVRARFRTRDGIRSAFRLVLCLFCAPSLCKSSSAL